MYIKQGKMSPFLVTNHQLLIMYFFFIFQRRQSRLLSGSSDTNATRAPAVNLMSDSITSLPPPPPPVGEIALGDGEDLPLPPPPRSESLEYDTELPPPPPEDLYSDDGTESLPPPPSPINDVVIPPPPPLPGSDSAIPPPPSLPVDILSDGANLSKISPQSSYNAKIPPPPPLRSLLNGESMLTGKETSEIPPPPSFPNIPLPPPLPDFETAAEDKVSTARNNVPQLSNNSSEFSNVGIQKPMHMRSQNPSDNRNRRTVMEIFSNEAASLESETKNSSTTVSPLRTDPMRFSSSSMSDNDESLATRVDLNSNGTDSESPCFDDNNLDGASSLSLSALKDVSVYDSTPSSSSDLNLYIEDNTLHKSKEPDKSHINPWVERKIQEYSREDSVINHENGMSPEPEGVYDMLEFAEKFYNNHVRDITGTVVLTLKKRRKSLSVSLAKLLWQK